MKGTDEEEEEMGSEGCAGQVDEWAEMGREDGWVLVLVIVADREGCDGRRQTRPRQG